MEFETNLEALQALQQDLIALLDSRLHNLSRLEQELSGQIADFRQLLDRKRRNETSRKAIRDAPKVKNQPDSSAVTIDGIEYAVSEEFKNAAFTVADEVDLDELDAAKLCLAVQNEVDIADETLPYRAVLRFHNERELTLECLRLILKRVADGDREDDDVVYEYFQAYIKDVVGHNSGAAESRFWTKCCAGLTEIEELVAKTQAQLQAMAMTDNTTRGARGEALQAQRMFLAHEHESLAAIMCYLVRTQHITLADYRRLLIKAAGTDAPFDILSHLAPPIIAGAAYFGSGNTVEDSQAQDIYRLLAPGPSQQAWKNSELHAATTIWWLVEYSARHSDVVHSAIGAKDKSQDAVERHELFFQCLDEKSFHFMLAIADFLKPEVWHDPAKAGLVRFLLDDTLRVPTEAVAPAVDFAHLTMEEFQNFTEAFISYMPDVLRQLKTEEDDKRRNQLRDDQPYYDMHLERFLLIVAYAYQDDSQAAMEFWSDTESNLYGFLRWTSTRLPTPRAAAFCELMRALANEERTADHAHRFLLEETTTIGGRLRKGYAVSWAQIFSTLDVYASSIQTQLTVVSPAMKNTPLDPDLLETETPIMLEAYLRLITHILRNSHIARNWVLREQPFRLHETLLSLAQSNIAPAVQACCFSVLTALLTNKTPDINDGLWLSLDNWISNGANQNNQRSKASVSERQYLSSYATNAEVAEALVHLISSLVRPVAGNSDIVLDNLPFPEAMATSHRRPGMDVYVDFVLSQAFIASADPATVGDRMQISVLRHACLTFAEQCLTSFNEDLILLAHNTSLGTEAAALQKSSATYIKLHPFARVVEYLFNDKVTVILLDAARQSPDELETLGPYSPLVQATVKAVQVMSLALEKQATYFNIVRPAIKTMTVRQRMVVANPAIASFEDVLTMNLELVLFLANYPACRHMDLTLASMKLLQQMSSSRKITGSPEGDGHRLVSKLASEGEALQQELRQNFIFASLRELEDDIDPVTSEKAKAVLSLLQSSLDASPETPNIAHVLLGFTCEKTTVRVAAGTRLADGLSLFHQIAEAAVTLQPALGLQHLSLLHAVRSGCIRLLTTLSSTQLTGSIVLGELRTSQYLAALSASSTPVAQQSLWEGVQADDLDIWLHQRSQALLSFLKERESVLDYAVKELQAVLSLDIVTLRQKVIGVLAGDSAAVDSAVPLMSVFDMIDFFDLKISPPLLPILKFLEPDFSSFPADINGRWDVSAIRQLLTLKKRELYHAGTIRDQADEIALNDEITALLIGLETQNDHIQVQEARLDALESWADVVSALVQTADGVKFAYQGLQLVVPRLDKAFRDDIPAAEQLAKLALVLVRTISASKSQLSSAVQDHLLQIFRISTRATIDSETTLALRDICYRMSCTVISTVLQHGKQINTTHRQQVVQHVKDIGDRIVRVLSEDAFSDRGVTRVSSLLFLDSLLQLSSFGQSSSVLLRSLMKVNFVPVLIDNSIGSVALTFRTPDVDLQSSLAYFHSAASLLLRITQLTDGPQLVLQSGFIAAVEESGLFSADPDIGLDIDNPEALDAYYQLLSALTRILVAIVVRRGSGDGSVIHTARRFLQDNRTSVSAVFKLASKQGTVQKANPKALEVAEELSRLMLVTDFMENDEAQSHKTNNHRFT